MFKLNLEDFFFQKPNIAARTFEEILSKYVKLL